MSYGSTVAVEEAEDEHRERSARLIAHEAAKLVAAGDMGRKEAVALSAEWLRNDDASEGDPTGVIAVENVLPAPSKASPSHKVFAIEVELLVAARKAAGV
jgi:hypothetical protein